MWSKQTNISVSKVEVVQQCQPSLQPAKVSSGVSIRRKICDIRLKDFVIIGLELEDSHLRLRSF